MNHTCDSLFVAYHSLWLDLKEDTLSWKQLDSLQTLQIRAIASIESSVQDYALAVLELIGDTVIVRIPEESTEESARYAFKEKEERKLPKLKKTQEVPFTIYPNPNSGLFTIELSEKTTGELRIQLTDLTGRVVFSSGYNEINTYLIGVDLSGLSKGVYLCSVFENNYIIGTQRVILIK